MNRITNKFIELRKAGHKALVGYITAGDPDFEMSQKIVIEACRAGIDILELGVPFSDPTSDGPVIQRASGRAIAKGMNLSRVLELVRAIRAAGIETPIVLFSYFNPIFRYGLKRFGADALAAGADGTLIVDLPHEESAEYTSQVSAELPLIHLVAPTTDDERMGDIVTTAAGFIYLITRTGVTGSGTLDTNLIASNVRRIRKHTDSPVCLGFGISNADDARNLRNLADGIIIGSAFEKIIEDNYQSNYGKLPDLLANAISLVSKELK